MKKSAPKLKRTEREVKVVRDYAEAILRAVPMPFLVLLPDLRVDTASEAFYKTFQATLAATEGRLVYEIGNGQWDIPELRELLQKIIPQHSVFTDFEVTHEFESIGRRTMLLNARRTEITASMPERILLGIEDITARKQTEELLRANRDTFFHLIENAPFGVYVVDAELRLRHVSAGSQKAFQNVRPLIGRDFTEVLRLIWPEPLAKEIIAHFRHTLQTGEPYLAPPLTERRADVDAVESYDWKIERIALPDGQWGVVCYFYDLTERNMIEDALRKSEARFRDMAENISQLAWVCDRIGDVVWYNQRWLDYTGLTFEEMKGWGWTQCHHPDYLDRVVASVQLSRETGQPWDYTFPLRGRDGSYRWFLTRAVPIRDEAGEVVRWFGTNTDVTEQREAVEALASAKEQVEAASRAKDDFLAALSHELRTPLTPVLMTTTALESDPTLPAEMREQLTMMRRNIELEARLIDDLLDITRISRGKLTIAPAPTDIHQLLNHTAEIVRSDELGKQVRIVSMLNAARHHVMADATRLQQVFWNLVKNALKFTPTGGTITVSTNSDDEGWIIVSVEDTGVGVSAEALPHIFKAFEQGDVSGQHRYGGLGLGLAISQAIVEVHGGTIQADSKGAGFGATFTVILATVDPPAATARATAPQPAPAPTLRLLVVEDHEATRTVISRLLTRSGHEVTTASTIRDALSVFVTERFDGVISDLGLPDGSGLDLMREIQRQRPVPAIALSGYGMEDDLRQTKEAGFFAHLVKPVNIDQLRLLLLEIPARWGAIAAGPYPNSSTLIARRSQKREGNMPDR